jgi:hypothetical protein
MGDIVTGHISKGAVHRKIDALVNRWEFYFYRRAAFLDALKHEAATVEIYLDILQRPSPDWPGVTQAEADYLRRTWFGTWWPGLQPVYPRVRHGLIKAIEEAGNFRLLDSYWCSAGADTVFEVFVLRSFFQVTRIILTPPPPTDAPVPPMRTNASPAWVVKPRVADEAPGTQTLTEIVETVIEPEQKQNKTAEQIRKETVTVWRVNEYYQSPPE